MYYVYGFLLLVLLMLLSVTALTAIVVTYVTLSVENHHWQWTAALSGASTALLACVYALYFFLFKTRMSGFYQAAFYVGYTAMGAGALACVCGATAYTAAASFVRRIFRSIKCD